MSPDSVAQDQIKSFVRRIEALEDEAKAINGDKSEVYKEARANGFDVKVLRKVIAARRQDHAERMEQDALFDLYMEALDGVVRAHVETIEEFDAETGEIKDPEQKVTAGQAERLVTAGMINTTVAEPVAVASSPTIPEPASPLPEIAEPGDESAVTSLAALVVADNVVQIKKRYTFNDKPHADCLDPERCGGFSNLKLCQRCQEAAAGGQVA